MAGARGVTCHVQCEIRSVRVTGLGCGGGTGGELFLRCLVPAGGGRAIQIDTRGADQPDGSGETTTGGAVSWRDVASLSCDGSPACVRDLVDRGAVVFEVRRWRGGRRRAVLLGRVLGSELIGRAEVPWRDAGGSGDVAVAVERRVELATPSSWRALGEEAPAILSARMSVRVSETPVPAGRGRAANSAAHPQGQSGCEWSAGDEDVFAAVACAADDAFE
ncbi:hypothetical protein PAHAL_2G452700 [Panicum hallii]|jgi:hypothetical protein|uniref:Uncharacterized protein n=1 Tax=Panicum hallii TaxID=206008 RepID=A0A2T8KSX6_9POAL|nr:uncharacterized protein LOC112883469 [Panicum hallii]PVH65287.1 hypothetical protein PAHAL_2G452700 [Panicum hallii]